MRFVICSRLLSMSAVGSGILVVPAMVEKADARSHRGDPPVFSGRLRLGAICCRRLRAANARDTDIASRRKL
jgi:hypothetical protein